MKKGFSIPYSVHPTPKPTGEGETTYHVRVKQRGVVHTKELRYHIDAHTMVKPGVFDLVMNTLFDEIAEQLLDGKGVHIDGLGLFSVQLGTVKQQDKDGHWHTKTYTSPSQLTAREVCVDGINFVPDKQMMMRFVRERCSFERDKYEPASDVPRGELIKTLAEHCAEHGSFTRREFQRMFGVTRYRADQILTALVSEEYPKYYRTKYGNLWVYRKTGM